MEQPGNRKSASQVSEHHHAPPEQENKPMSPKTKLLLDEQSLDGRRKYKGSFPFTVPNMGHRVDIGVLKTQYLNEVPNVEGEAQGLAEALAYLGVTLDHEKCPDWWTASNNGIGLYDYPPLVSLYAQARAYAATFLGAAAEPTVDESADAGGPGTDGDGDVEPDLQPPPERSETLVEFGPGSHGAPGDISSGEGNRG